MSGLLIRPLQEADLDALLGLYAQLHQVDAPLPERSAIGAIWREILANANQHYFGGFLDGKLVSTCLLTTTPNLTRGCRPFGLIENVVTDAAWRKRGYARELLRHASDIAWQHGCYKVMLMTSRKDEATIAFYESAGFDRHTKQAFYAAAPT